MTSILYCHVLPDIQHVLPRVLCFQETFVGDDCTSTRDVLTLDASYTNEPRAGFAFDHFEMPVGDAMLSAPGAALLAEGGSEVVPSDAP